MTIAQYAPAITRGSSRWLLLGSLALNLFFVGVAVAMAIRAPAAPAWDRNVFVRVERIADTLAAGRCRPAARPDQRQPPADRRRAAAIPLRAGPDPRDAAARAVRRRGDARRHGEDPGGAAGLRSGHPGRVRVLGVADVAGRPQRAGRLAARPQNSEQSAIKQANFPPDSRFEQSFESRWYASR